MMLIIKLLLTFLLLSCSSNYVKTEFLIPTESYIPVEVSENFDEFITATVFDTIDWNVNDKVFKPFVQDSGIVFCPRDVVLYINDKNLKEYYQVELKARKDFERQFILSSIAVEKGYQNALEDVVDDRDKLYKEYVSSQKMTNIYQYGLIGISLIFIGFFLNSL